MASHDREHRVAGWICLGLLGLPVLIEASPLRPLGITTRVLLWSIAAVPAGLVFAWSRGRLLQALLLLGSAVGCLLAAELVLTWTLFPRPGGQYRLFTEDADLGWRFLPGAEEVVVHVDYQNLVRINSEGFRDTEPSSRNEDLPAVAVVGDSFTANIGVSHEENFTSVMQRRLGPELAVRNFGVPGYGQVQELLMLRGILERRRFDLVLLLLYIRNDLDDNTGRFDWIRGYRRPGLRIGSDGGLEFTEAPPAIEQPRKDLYRRVHDTALLRLIGRVRASDAIHEVPEESQPPELRFCRTPLGEEAEQAFAVTEKLLLAMREMCASHGCRLAVVLAPSLWQAEPRQWDELLQRFELSPSDYDRAGPQKRLAQSCAGLGIECLDLLPLLEGAGEGPLYFEHEQHWNAAGNLRAGEAIAAWLRREQLVSGSGAAQPSPANAP